ncbi:MAG: SufD family Fe-S cluster assembly protein [Lachnospiraceae bacterium]|nr:SufD family Fe-S cluster assembly protein [Lachnospiraceae bacterium]
MANTKELVVNALPSKTWYWLKINDARLSVPADVKELGPSIDNKDEHVTYKKLSLVTEQGEGKESPAFWRNIKTGAGMEGDFITGSQADLLIQKAGTETKAPVVLHYDYDKTGAYGDRLYLYAEKDSTLKVVVIAKTKGLDISDTSEKELNGSLGALQTRIYTEEGAKVELHMLQLLSEESVYVSDIGGHCEEDGAIRVTRLELGSGKLYAAAEVDLVGKRSDFTAEIGYSARHAQKYDMNYVARHRGRKTTCEMNVNGVLWDKAEKVFRGTIDFICGCAEAKGNEKEEVLMLGEDVINHTIPLILCNEEDVEGNHGATIGELDQDTLFYLGSRGIDPETAKVMVAASKLEAVSQMIPNGEIRKLVDEFVRGTTEDAEL